MTVDNTNGANPAAGQIADEERKVLDAYMMPGAGAAGMTNDNNIAVFGGPPGVIPAGSVQYDIGDSMLVHQQQLQQQHFSSGAPTPAHLDRPNALMPRIGMKETLQGHECTMSKLKNYGSTEPGDFEVENCMLIEKPEQTNVDLIHTLHDCIGFCGRLPLRGPNCDHEKPESIVQKANEQSGSQIAFECRCCGALGKYK